jgi:hypothetical protein
MIRHDFDRAAVEQAITDVDRRWLGKAATRTAKLKAARAWDDSAGIWSDIKPAFMRLQHGKCIYCERQFESVDYGRIEFDVEHFRPKGRIMGWPDGQRHPDLHYAFDTGPAAAKGYYWMAFDPHNYAASCKVCNSTFKLDFFPVAAPRAAELADQVGLHEEQPFLCLPLGREDDDPEDLLTFVATTAIPTAKDGHKRDRGQVIIDFFGLNARDQLHRERARMIALFGPALRAIATGTDDASDRRLVGKMTEPQLPHASCLRAYKRLWDTDPPTAKRALELCRDYALSDSGTRPPEL